ncbi:MAG: glycosyltransferase [Deinococcales bacterium]
MATTRPDARAAVHAPPAAQGAGAPRLLLLSSVPSTLTAFLLPYAAHYRERGWRVDAACRGGTLCAPCAAAFDHVYEVPWTRDPLDPVNLTAAPRAVRRLVHEHGYAIVHAHDPVAGFVTRLALRDLRRRLGVRVVVTAHGFHFFRGNSAARNLVFRTLERTASRWTDALVVINREDLAAAQRFGIASERVVYMPGIGVDTARYDPARVSAAAVGAVRRELALEEGQPLLLMVAEFNPGKRHLDAVEALARCGRERVVLACAGLGPRMEAVRAQAERLGLADRVRLLGYRDDVPALLRASLALLLPSEREGLPRSVMEALALERPVIASRIRGVEELVDEGTGILHEVGDVEALAAAIRRLVDDPAEAAAMGRRGRLAMRPFDLTQVLALHDVLYERLLRAPA